MDTEAFEAAYAKLNPEQQKAVDAIEGPVMVIAGPGTGKTQILTLRIANILKNTDTQPEQILALTFTDSGAKAMRMRLFMYIGEEAYRVAIYTFHGFAEMLIRTYPESFPRIIGGRAIGDIELIESLELILNSLDVHVLRPIGNPSYYIYPLKNILGELKKEYVSPDDMSVIIKNEEDKLQGIDEYHTKGPHKGKRRSEYINLERKIDKLRELQFVYRSYEAFLREENLYDFEDMIVETVRSLEKNPELLSVLQETYHYILADEHQDVNQSQNRILELLSSFHENPNLFVVGDEKQAIYRFQGASLENFLYFGDSYESTLTIALTQNYRSVQKILDAAHELIAVDDGPLKDLRVSLQAYSNQDGDVRTALFSHEAVENEWIVKDIKDRINNSVDPHEIAIIVRTNREVESLASLLEKHNVRSAPTSDTDILTHPLILNIRYLIEAVVSPSNERALFEVLHGSYWKLSPHALFTILSQRNYSTTLSEVLKRLESAQVLTEEDTAIVKCITATLEEVRVFVFQNTPLRSLEFLLTKSGLLSSVMENDPLEGSAIVRRFYDDVGEELVRGTVRELRDIVTLLDRRIKHGLPLTAPRIGRDTSGVRVMTAHKSKGLEFTYVYIPHMTDAGWGGRPKRDHFGIAFAKTLTVEPDPLDDERRLLFVAMTRAKLSLTISSAQMNATGKVFTPSRLLQSMNNEHFTTIDTEPFESSFNPVGSLELKKIQAFPPDLFKNILLERGLSATSLNNYLKSPWNYLYRNVFRIPAVEELSMEFGTVLHKVLEESTRFHSKSGTVPTDTQIKTWFDNSLSKLVLTQKEYSDLHERGFGALVKYIKEHSPYWPKTKKEEFSIRVELPTGDSLLPSIPLTGKLDRLDMNEDGEVVCVIDYKSGKPKTRGYIEGKTKGSNGDYKRQLIFYALLLQLYGDERYRCTKGVLSFVEADKKGNLHDEPYTVSQTEIDDLKTEIIRVGLEISNGAFLNAPCDPTHCDYCSLVAAFLNR